MDDMEFGRKCLRWYELQQEAAEIAAELEAETLARGKTQTFGRVRVTFSNPRKSYDYPGAWAKEYGEELPSKKFEKITYDYRAACAAVGIEVEGVASGEPSAKIKLI